MTLEQQLATIFICSGATVLTRFLPFFAFSSKRPIPPFVEYLGKALPSAVFGMLVIYCLKDVNFLSAPESLPELAAIAAVIALHLWKKNMMLSMVGGTALYMLLVHFV